MACERVKGFLSQAGVPYTARNVDEDPSAYDELLAAGFRTIPVAMWRDVSVRGFDPEALRALADRVLAEGVSESRIPHLDHARGGPETAEGPNPESRT